jgi:hypothetical protein
MHINQVWMPLTIVINQGIHFINDVVKYLTNHFLLKHVSSTTLSLREWVG